MATRKKTPRKTSFVPRVVFATALVGSGVIPLCVTACGGKADGNAIDSGPGATVAAAFVDSGRRPNDSGFGVADIFAADVDSGFSVADVSFPTVAADAFSSVADVGFTVAMVGFDAEAGDAPFDSETGPTDAGEG